MARTPFRLAPLQEINFEGLRGAEMDWDEDEYQDYLTEEQEHLDEVDWAESNDQGSHGDSNQGVVLDKSPVE